MDMGAALCRRLRDDVAVVDGEAGRRERCGASSRLAIDDVTGGGSALRGGRVVGILSERDIALVAGLPSVDPAKVAVQDAMSEEVYSVRGETPLDEVAATMAAHRYGSALVVEERDHVIGVFTTVDALHALADGAPTRTRRAPGL